MIVRVRNLLSIGTLSNASALSVKALRRYHDLALLVPAVVDARTGYRGYSVSQITEARIIRRLRLLDMPLEDIARILRAGDPAEDRRVTGPLQELYLAGPPDVADAGAWRTEVGWPVAAPENPEPDERITP